MLRGIPQAMPIKIKYSETTLPAGIHDTSHSPFIQALLNKWDEINCKPGVFRYKLDNLQEKVVGMKYLFQLNPDRGTNRRFPEHIENIMQPFDSNNFNFTKISPEEIMFTLVKEENDIANLIIVNVSPISSYHSLLCPSVDKCLPQIVTCESLTLILEIMFLSENRDLRIGFNSLCALASVNHLHYHLLIEKHTLPVETLKCKNLKGTLYYFDEYPVPGYCFQIETKTNISPVVKDMLNLLEYFLKKNIAHNIFVTRGEHLETSVNTEVIRIFIWPRKSCYGVKTIASFNVALCELSGWFPIYNKEDYDTLQSTDIEVELQKWRITGFKELCNEIKMLY